MNKVASYLNEHILGEVSSETAVRQAMSTDASILTLMPEMVVYPRTTNDIRKIARFSNQLAEKGHVLAITPRGGGSDQTGGAIGSGVIVNMTAHMNTIYEMDMKQRLIRVQPGVNFQALNDALRLQGLHIPSAPMSASYSTIGGAVANNAAGIASGKYGATGRWVHQIEVVLSNGDVIQTGRVSKRDLNRKKGQQNFEGEIYRQIDNLITDNQDVIDNGIAYDIRDNSGYNGIVDVKRKDGSIDLAPLFIGSQGTLGIVSEIIMKADYVCNEPTIAALAFDSWDAARDAVAGLDNMDPYILELLDGSLFERALLHGKKYSFYDKALEQSAVAAVILIGFDELNDRQRAKKRKKLEKQFSQVASFLQVAKTSEESSELHALRSVTYMAVHPDGAGMSSPPLVDGVYIPPERFEDFMVSLKELAAKFHMELPIYGHLIDNVYYVRPELQLSKVGDKQKVFKFTDEYANLVASHKGHIIGESAEGRFKAHFVQREFDDDVKAVYASIKAIFDPLGIMNTGVKEPQDVKVLVSQLRKDYDLAQFASFAPLN